MLGKSIKFPDPSLALSGAHNGLLAIGGDLSVPRLLSAYQLGIFPWTIDPITWWSPDPRGILELDQFHISTSLGKILRRGTFRVTINTAFQRVMECCRSQRPGASWISRPFIDAYQHLHQAGHAHSVECWLGNQLAGGIYGVAIGGLFAGESMFHHVDNASKVALAALVSRLHERGYELFDLQMVTPFTRTIGAIEIPRSLYLARLKQALSRSSTFA